MGISNFVNVNNIGITSVRSKKQGELADLIVEQIRIQSYISKLAKIQKKLTNLYRSVKVNKTNFDKLTSQQRTKRYNNATKMVNDLENQRNEVEKTINDMGTRAKDGKIGMDELSGGTFTISNGGVYGSLMSTPILNPPQSGILGMHKIQKRPVAVGDNIEIRPMMYLALSYDHRIIDGREAVSFLVKIKEIIEDPRRLILDI